MTPRIKLCHVITRMDRGGAPDIVRILCEKFDPARFETTLIYGATSAPSQRTADFIKQLGGRAILLSSLRRDIDFFHDAAAFFGLLRIFLREKFDVVHLHTAKAGFLGRLAARCAGCRVVVYSTHGHDFYGYFGKGMSFLIALAERFASRFCEKIHVLTELEKKDLLKFRICAAQKLEVIYSGLDLEALRISRSEAGRMRPREEGYRVGIVGRLEPVKGPDIFIEAAQVISSALPDAKFFVVGDGSMRTALEKLARERGLRDKITFTGWLEDPGSLLATLDVLVMPSSNEAVGRSALEAQAVGVPVVATRVGGVPEVVRDGVTGILVEPKNPRLVAEAVLELLKNVARRRSMSEAGRGWVDERFSDRAMVEKFENLYIDLLKNPSADRKTGRPKNLKTFCSFVFWFFCFLVFCGVGTPVFAGEGQKQWIPVAMHVGTTVSDGSLSLSEIIAAAREKGNKAVIVTDRDAMKWEYGLWPLRNLIKKTIEMNSVFRYGISNYLKTIELESKKNPDMLIIPGVESSPYYRWEGTPFTHDFKILNWHRHILVIGLDKQHDYSNLPTIANKKGIRRRITPRDLLSLVGLLAAPALGFWLTRIREMSYKDAQGRELGRHSASLRVAGIFVIIASALLLLDGLPYFPQAYTPYGRSAGSLPYQMLIDYANKKGALTFWAHPEAQNFTERDGIKIETKEHAAYLYRTHGYTGFSIFHEGYEKVGRVGGDWDALLREFCDGRRQEPVWAVAGLAFDQGRREDLKKLMDDVQVYVSASKFSREAVLEAMRRGAMYVSRGGGVVRNQLFLEKFVVEDEATRTSTGMGGRLRVAGEHAVVVRARFAQLPGPRDTVKVRLIRDGKIIREYSVSGEKNASGGVHVRHVENQPLAGHAYYRLEITCGAQLIVTNPIFVNL